MMMPLLRDWDFDALITHNRFTLANRNAEDDAGSRGVARHRRAQRRALRRRHARQGLDRLSPLRLSGGLGSGAGSDPPIEAICARHGVPPGAAALQFSLRDPRVTSTICGVTKPERVKQTLDWARFPIPDEAWEELMALPFRHRRSRGDARLQAGIDPICLKPPSPAACRSPPGSPSRRNLARMEARGRRARVG